MLCVPQDICSTAATQKMFFKNCVRFFFLLFDCPMANSGPFSREKPHSLILITAFWTILTKGHRELRDEVGSLSTVECLVGLGPGPFQRISSQKDCYAKISVYNVLCPSKGCLLNVWYTIWMCTTFFHPCHKEFWKTHSLPY